MKIIVIDVSFVLYFSTHYLKAPFVFDLSTQVQIQLGDQQSITNTRQALKTFYFDTSTSGTKKKYIQECDYHPVPPRNLSHKSVQNLYERDVHHPKWIHWENFQCPRDWWRRQNNYTHESRKWIFSKQSPNFGLALHIGESLCRCSKYALDITY